MTQIIWEICNKTLVVRDLNLSLRDSMFLKMSASFQAHWYNVQRYTLHNATIYIIHIPQTGHFLNKMLFSLLFIYCWDIHRTYDDTMDCQLYGYRYTNRYTGIMFKQNVNDRRKFNVTTFGIIPKRQDSHKLFSYTLNQICRIKKRYAY